MLTVCSDYWPALADVLQMAISWGATTLPLRDKLTPTSLIHPHQELRPLESASTARGDKNVGSHSLRSA